MYKWILVPLLITTILVWSACATLPDGKLHVSFLDVGQGDSILVQTPHGQNILIDGGPSPQQIDMGLSQHLAFWDRNIDLMISTQPQADHLTGLVEVLQRYKVKRVLEPGVPYDSLVYNEWCQLIADKGIQHDIATAGQKIDLGDGITMEVLNPQKVFFEGSSDDVDNNDIVLRLSWGEVSFLFTADIRTEAELELILQRANIKTAVLKVGHHGSKTSTSPGFLAAVDPEIAVISVGEDNPFGHPSPQVVERLEEKIGQDNLYLTSQNGTIEFTTDGKSLWVKTER
jgi:competence protein ComEC